MRRSFFGASQLVASRAAFSFLFFAGSLFAGLPLKPSDPVYNPHDQLVRGFSSPAKPVGPWVAILDVVDQVYVLCAASDHLGACPKFRQRAYNYWPKKWQSKTRLWDGRENDARNCKVATPLYELTVCDHLVKSSLSHRDMVADAKKHKYQRILVLEDDAAFASAPAWSPKELREFETFLRSDHLAMLKLEFECRDDKPWLHRDTGPLCECHKIKGQSEHICQLPYKDPAPAMPIEPGRPRFVNDRAGCVAMHGVSSYVMPFDMYDKMIDFYAQSRPWQPDGRSQEVDPDFVYKRPLKAPMMAIDMWTWIELKTQVVVPQLGIQTSGALASYWVQRKRPGPGDTYPLCTAGPSASPWFKPKPV